MTVALLANNLGSFGFIQVSPEIVTDISTLNDSFSPPHWNFKQKPQTFVKFGIIYLKSTGVFWQNYNLSTIHLPRDPAISFNQEYALLFGLVLSILVLLHGVLASLTGGTRINPFATEYKRH